MWNASCTVGSINNGSVDGRNVMLMLLLMQIKKANKEYVNKWKTNEKVLMEQCDGSGPNGRE